MKATRPTAHRQGLTYAHIPRTVTVGGSSAQSTTVTAFGAADEQQEAGSAEGSVIYFMQ
ncbi:hypothetical protein [Rhodanobacter sp. MP1X3]|uniref:hypothetical protein n=1 Tax=Rhodanobacter sp. MP1X3 TaxID=2723086 RepID=UPI0016086A0B|nr:hypothetical protein [Rhodanobacter sp. MP1X3]